jgi:serine protease AprX
VKIKALLLSFILLISTFFSMLPVTHAGLTLSEAQIDPDLESLLQTSVDPIDVIVTFRGDGGPSESQLNLLKDLGITQGALHIKAFLSRVL